MSFPPEEQILSYLEQHPDTGKIAQPYLSEKKILNAVAAYFADRKQLTPDAVTLGVALTLTLASRTLGLPPSEGIPFITITTVAMRAALMDCANGKPLENEMLSCARK